MLLIQTTIILSLIITVVVGLMVGKKIQGASAGFVVARRTLPAWLVAGALFAQAIDGNATLGNTGLAFDFGFWAGASLPIGLAIALFILGRFFAPKLHAMQLSTLADFFAHKYNRTVTVIAALLMLLTFGLLLAGNIAFVASLIQPYFPVHYASLVILVCIMVLLYSIRGGIISDIYTDFFQMGLLVVSMVLVAGVLVWQYDIGSLLSGVDYGQTFSLTQLTTTSGGGLINWATLVALGFGNILAIDFAARLFSAQSPVAARQGCYRGAWLTLLVGLPFTFLPVIIQQLGITPIAGESILMTFGSTILPPLVYALLISAIIGAALSTIDGAMLSMGNILTYNLLNLPKDVSTDESDEAERILLYFSRLTLLPIAFLAMTFAIVFPAPGALLTVGFDIMFAALLVPFLTAFYGQRASVRGALAAIATGVVVRILFAILTPTAFGVPNTFLFLPNNIIPPEWDGLGTILAPLCAAVVYVVVMMLEKNKANVYDPAH